VKIGAILLWLHVGVVLVCNTVTIVMCGLYAKVSVGVPCGSNCNMGLYAIVYKIVLV
jgi:hypothetical protein